MPDRSRIPRKIADFNAYINNSTNYLLQLSPISGSIQSRTSGFGANWKKQGILSSQMQVFDILLAQWRILYKLYSSENTRTTAIESELTIIQIKLTEFIEQFPDLVSALENRKSNLPGQE